MNQTGIEKEVMEESLRIIRRIFFSRKIEIGKIIFFGSRAKGDYHQESDWDFLVVANHDLLFKEKHQLIMQIKRELAKLGIPNDILIQSRTRFEALKKCPGNISYVANLEGIPL